MLRWLLLIALVYVAYRWWSRVSRAVARSKHKVEGEPMVECTLCGIHIPQSESVTDEGKHFCSDAHHLSWKREH